MISVQLFSPGFSEFDPDSSNFVRVDLDEGLIGIEFGHSHAYLAGTHERFTPM
jgi:hypothetical protein